jgi:energy-converting hydrogenase Eha subunit E
MPPYGDDGSAGNSGPQRVIRNADLSLDVENLDAALDELGRNVRQAGGFVANSSVSGRGENRSARLTIRVPEARLDSFLEQGSKLGKVNYVDISSDDVTLRYIDLEARIHNLERQEERLLSILDKAETIEDILRIEQELARVRGQLESLTGEFRYLRDRVDYSTVTISMRETPTASPVITGSGLKGVWQRGIAGLVNTVNGMLTGLGSILVFLLTFLPLFALLTVIAVVAVFIMKRIGKDGRRTPDA